MSVDAPGTPPAESEITEALIRQLVTSQFPQFASLPVEIVGEGWDNVMARIGEDLAARLPRHAVGERLLKNEQRWLPELAPRLPLPVPAPLHIGKPEHGYPFTWSIVRWWPGEVAAIAPPAPSEAATLAGFLKALHQKPPPDAPVNPVRGGPLTNKQVDTERRMRALSDRPDLMTPKLTALWQAALAEPNDTEPVWLAGDIHPQNVLVKDGKFSAFIDWGDICTGDCATDLASIWMLFGDANARRSAIEAYGMSASTQLRAKGWAVFFGAILLETGRQDDPLHAKTGETTLRRLNADG